ncbi:D-alanine--D-alanyl carrier protein ligase [Seminavis robusta]|uniref:D-alanine--D-alanyl carrier protein ligase n=1 Tax=Seminavis robusta TaxID=568900 RepID=A0A9N8DVR6_9STRA|nr:D-alanine--D-alanyl carrier protein ligase [Seminavis robusta]|eukprot:Sro329_g118830.1 D-alanine--D-alanyl carrier protein ligase (1811) ;mRNA; f:54079-59779
MFFSTILEALNYHASETPEKILFTWVDIKCKEQNKMTFRQLEDESNAVAARLLKLGCSKGDRVMVAYPFGLEFLAGMFGAMKIGVIPCSIYPPNPNQLKTEMPKFRGFAEDAGAKYALTSTAFATAMTAVSVLYKTGVKWIGTDNLQVKKRNANKQKAYETYVGAPEDICFIQYTSGSTGRPKGVMIGHHNLVENIRGISCMSDTDVLSSTVAALWVPQYHDMGLVAGFMSTVYGGIHLVMASPLDFVSNPLLWSDMVETYKATLTCAPNFAYALLLKRLQQANRTADWSCVKRAMFGGEPSQSHIVEAVSKTLNINQQHIYNIYGMAESVVFLTGGPANAEAEGLVSCAGYYGQSELTTATFANALPSYDGTWLDTGDLGKIVDGQLYVTGRVKDVIIINGKNYYPTDLELSIDDLFGDVIRPGRTTAFQYGDDSIGITVEGRKQFDELENKDLAVHIANHASQVHGLLAVKVVVLKLGVTPKTTSGKLKRSEIRKTTIASDWKESSVLLQFQREETIVPLLKTKRASFLENSFSNQGIPSSEFYLSKGTQREIKRRSMTLLDLKSMRTMMDSIEDPSHFEEYDEKPLHVAVVGAGAAGLIAALRLAQRNIKVTLLECNEQIGGHARHVEVFGHERNPAFGVFIAGESPNLMALAEELGVAPIPLGESRQARGLVSQKSQPIPEVPLSEISRFIAEMQRIHKAGSGQNETIGEFLDQNGYDQHFIVYFYVGRIVSFFAGQSIQDYLNIPLELVAWFVIIGFAKNRAFLRMSNREYMEAFWVQLQSLSVEIKTNVTTKVLGRADSGVTLSTSCCGKEDVLLVDKLVLAVPPNAAAHVLENSMSPQENVLTEFDCPLETVVMHTDSNWIDSKKPCVLFANILDWGKSSLPAASDTIPLTTSFPSDTDGKTPIYVTHAYNTYEELEFDSPVETMSFTHTRITCKAIELRNSLLQHQGNDSTYFAGGWTRGTMLHEDAIVSGILASNSVLQDVGMKPHPVLERETIVPSNRLSESGGADHGQSDIQAPNKDGLSSRYSDIIMSVFGSEVDSSKTWTENGLTSLKSAEFRNKVEEELLVVLPSNFEQLYPTPEALSVFLASSEGKGFPIDQVCAHADFLFNTSRSKLSNLQLCILQTLGFILILLLPLMSLVPSYFLVSWIMDNCGSGKVGECNGPLVWTLLPMAFPLFILSFSSFVVFLKYAIVGKYRHQQFEILSWDYLRWWFMDRLIEVWESIVGQFFVETKYIWIFYWLLGADLAWSSKIESYIRECDLVKVGENATIGYPIKCRKFSHSEESSPTITFRPIVVGSSSNVSGMISPGANIGDGSKVEKLSVVEEGAQVPEAVLARGNPAYNAGTTSHQESSSFEESMFDFFKVAWISIEAYHFFSLSYLVHITLNQILPSWRYEVILHWILLFPASSFLALLTSLILKWTLIGRRDPSDQYEASLYHRATNWACDFHFRVASWTLTPFFGQSRLWNIILFLHGLDVDMDSILNNPYIIFFPSKVDFVKIRKSFVGTITLDMTTPADSKIELNTNSSVGYGVNVHAGVKVMRSTIPPRSNVSDSVYDLNHSGKAWKPSSSVLLLPEETQLLLNVAIFVSLIPAFEIGIAALMSSSTAITMFGLTGAISLQLFVWILLTRAVESLMLRLPHSVQQDVFGIYINNVWMFGVGNWLVILLCGTPMFAYYARFMRADVDGDLWYFGNSLYEYGKLHFQGCVIIDSAHVSGHYIDGNGLALADTYVSGLLHPGCYASAGSVVTGKENGPWKVFLRSDLGKQDLKRGLKEKHQDSMDNLIDSPQDDLMDELPNEIEV